MKFQSKINYVQECVAVLSNAAGGEYDLARELQTDTLPEDCRKDLELLSQIQREAVEGLSKENIEFYFKPLDNARTCVASLLGRFHVIHALDELEEEGRMQEVIIDDGSGGPLQPTPKEFVNDDESHKCEADALGLLHVFRSETHYIVYNELAGKTSRWDIFPYEGVKEYTKKAEENDEE